MNKTPLVVFSTDWHLQTSNIPQIKDLITQQCELAKKLRVKYLVCTGDVFESRIAQREDCLTAFSEILSIIESYSLKLWLIPGNHDKTVYSSIDSFLHPYKDNPCLTLVDRASDLRFTEHELTLHLMPFFSEDIWLKNYGDYMTGPVAGLELGCKNILCTHIAVTGSQNNDGTLVSSAISSKLFKDFFKVLSGHYHDQQKIGSNFYHIPSIQQNNFGENTDKGFTVLYSDGSHELVKSKFREYVKVKVDLDSISTQELTDLRKKYKGNENNIRFEITGSENVLKSLRKEDFTSLGIDLKTKSKEVMSDIIFSDSAEVKEHTCETIKEEFVKFCEQENLDSKVGMKYLSKKL